VGEVSLLRGRADGSLIYEGGIKEKLLRYMNTSLVFADCEVDPNVISSNR
jgi:hypothetical protein